MRRKNPERNDNCVGTMMSESEGECSRCGTMQTWRSVSNLMCDECLDVSLAVHHSLVGMMGERPGGDERERRIRVYEKRAAAGVDLFGEVG